MANKGNFNGISEKFAKSIYASSKGKLRMAVLARDLQPLVQAPTLDVLDIGAGLGQVNSWFLAAGHRLVHSDIAAEMVADAKAYHQQQGLTDNVRYLACPLQQLPQHLGQQQFDLVLCHAVLEWLDDPRQGLLDALSWVKPGGQLSLMFYNRDAKLLANAIYGNFDYIERGLKVKKTVRMSPKHPIALADMTSWLDQQKLEVISKTGVRCFHDYLRDPADQQRYHELLAIEMRYNQTQPFQPLGRYQHWLIRKTAE
ncbi:SAM-dependent methyltransferase [Idiomarina tyrosinivorans]|uniref:tRNA 5-carboxymethoxyuridine methyltransferase n=1 Tax=Idiomarina tyrosinivorans TaxID=1445662 RepID=A0A432ZU22_9GAMM|nr:methyltransferase domain-containing protein [Idiomarina tyrosinivorans]RUO81389.1 SAM-dependent methyltransferase [Idiomarina tyrosinivorans]